MTKRGAVFLAMLALVACAGTAGAVTTLEGYSEVMAEIRSSGGGDSSWDLSNPKLYSELRLKSSPWRGVDSFLKVSAESNRWPQGEDIKDTKFFFREAHMRYRAERFETHLFTGQDRFWLNEPLLEIVNTGVVKHDDYGTRAQGVRVDFWDLGGFTGAAFVSERSDYVSAGFSQLSEEEQEGFPGAADGDTISNSTDDYRGLRVTRDFMSDRIYLGTTYGRKDFGTSAYEGATSSFDEVVAFDAEFALGDLVPFLQQFGRVTWVSEFGFNTSGHLWDDEDPRRNGFKTELRDIRAGAFRFKGSFEEFGKDFYTVGLSSGDKNNLNDYTQYYGEAHYRVPLKAINVKGWMRHAEPNHPGVTSYSNSVGTTDEWGTEAYLEFVNGFTGKAEYKVYEDQNGTWPNLLLEATGENRLVKLRTQFRIKDIDSVYELTAYGFEANVNLSDSWKFYARVLNVDEKTESRQTAFAQLRYTGWGGAEFFVEFGNPGHSDDLANDGDFVQHGSNNITEQVFKAFVKIYY
ncbi:MAG: hypothetical protein ABIG03_04895 [Candidatus Eisenbacteria bacterium]